MHFMRYPPEHKKQTLSRIVQAAAGLFRSRGYAATGVDAVMASANLTAGGFYSHFRSKENLLAEALDVAFRQSQENWPPRLKELRGKEWVREFVSFYLCSGHRDAPEAGCPMPSLTPEIRRIDGTPRNVFERHLRGLIETVNQHMAPRNRYRAISAIALCVGGLMLARTVQDPALSEEILRACREAVIEGSQQA